MKVSFIILTLTGLILSACSPLSTGESMNQVMNNPPSAAPVPGTGPGLTDQYPDLGAAPELVNQVWLNSPPLRIADLRGKVVLIDMWTFFCINCIHVVPYLEGWYQKYAGQGLVVIGNHFPEFDYERDLGNLKDAVKRLGITYPVDQDNDGATWNAYKNRYWPTMYLIDKRGHIRYMTIGEGNYTSTENAIAALLKEPDL